MCKGDATTAVRMDCLNKKTIDNYFANLKECLEENNLMNIPGQLYNVDKTGIPLDHCQPKAVAKRGKQKIRCCTTENKEQITVIGCVSASGHAIPPYVIFDTKQLNYAWTKEEVPGTQYCLNNKGWIDNILFRDWLQNHFIKHVVASRSLLLLLDGHSSHYELDTLKFAKANDVIIFCLSPHTSHGSQPLDPSVFGPLKRQWADAYHNYMEKIPIN